MLRNADDYGFIPGMMKNTMDILVSNVKTNLSSQTSTIRWGFYLPLPEAIKEITNLTEQGKVSLIHLRFSQNFHTSVLSFPRGLHLRFCNGIIYWSLHVIRKLPDATPDHVCCQFKMAYQLVLQSRQSPGTC
jgi:hypothetical protein